MNEWLVWRVEWGRVAMKVVGGLLRWGRGQEKRSGGIGREEEEEASFLSLRPHVLRHTMLPETGEYSGRPLFS